MLKLQFIDECNFQSDTSIPSTISELITEKIKQKTNPEEVKDAVLALLIGKDFPVKGFEYKLKTETIEAFSLEWRINSVTNHSYYYMLRFRYISPIYQCKNIFEDKSYELIDSESGESFIYSKKI